MLVIKFFLLFFLFIFLYGLISIAVMVFKSRQIIKHMMNNAKQSQAGQSASQANSSAQSSASSSAPQKKKIFPADEGEYVEYEEIS